MALPAGQDHRTQYLELTVGYDKARNLVGNPTGEDWLRWMVTHILGKNINNSDVWQALQHNGITDYDDFKNLSEEDITSLNYIEGNPQVVQQLPQMKKRLLIIAQLYHCWIQAQLGTTLQVDQLD